MVERGPLKGREQEWNISRKELNELVSCSHRLLDSCHVSSQPVGLVALARCELL